ncbi:MAG: twin-arginine translocation signal domain-containing protein [Nitriliruptorales bacterium]|nr:twin-arginine translocation signal domain-containing protein [Nitriliruptorales bacterium]
MDRRSFLKGSGVALGAVGLGGLLAACADGSERDSADGQAGVAEIPSGEATLAPTIATFEFLTGSPRKVPFGVRTMDNVEVRDADITVYLRTLEGEVIDGPLGTTYTEATGPGLGLYVVELGFDEAGTFELVAVDGDSYGMAAVPVVTPEQSKAPVPGQAATAVATPTEDNERGYDKICTQDPPCGMHDVNLEDALAGGKPVMLIFATPEFCQTVVCGPAVDTVDTVRKDGDWGDSVWIHTEIYAHYDPNNPELGKPVKAWNLPTEPWLFSIDPDGKLVDRLDGPMLPDMVEEMAQALTA